MHLLAHFKALNHPAYRRKTTLSHTLPQLPPRLLPRTVMPCHFLYFFFIKEEECGEERRKVGGAFSRHSALPLTPCPLRANHCSRRFYRGAEAELLHHRSKPPRRLFPCRFLHIRYATSSLASLRKLPCPAMHRPMHTLKSDKKEVEQINCVWCERGKDECVVEERR